MTSTASIEPCLLSSTHVPQTEAPQPPPSIANAITAPSVRCPRRLPSASRVRASADHRVGVLRGCANAPRSIA